MKTAAWVPILFGVAGFLMSSIILTLDNWVGRTDSDRNLSWPKVLYGILLFSFQYWFSGFLDNALVPSPTINILLLIIALSGTAAFGLSRSTLILSASTFAAGPLTEIFLINELGLYQYTHPVFLGICNWIPWVYWLGAVAVGNLARKLHNTDLPLQS